MYMKLNSSSGIGKRTSRTTEERRVLPILAVSARNRSNTGANKLY